MWGILGAGAVFIMAIILSLLKVSSRGEKIAEQHREELLTRNRKEEQLPNEDREEQETVKKKNPSSFS